MFLLAMRRNSNLRIQSLRFWKAYHPGFQFRCCSRVCLVSNTRVGVRFIRTRGHDKDREFCNEGHEGRRTSESDEKSDQDGKRREESEESSGSKTIDPMLARKLRIYVLAMGGISFVTSFILLSQMWKEGNGVPNGVKAEHFTRTGIDFNTFVDKYLKSGEVSSIVFCPQNQRALVILHPAAVIDGQVVSDNVVVVSYSQNAQQFWADVRKEESLMGISLSNGVKIDMYQGLTTLRVIEMMIGFLILMWLGTQYGRLLRKRFIERKADGAGPKS